MASISPVTIEKMFENIDRRQPDDCQMDNEDWLYCKPKGSGELIKTSKESLKILSSYWQRAVIDNSFILEQVSRGSRIPPASVTALYIK